MIEWQVCLWFDKSYCICTSIYIEIDIKFCCTEHFCQSIIVYNVVTCTLRCLIIFNFRRHPTLNSIRIPRTNTDQYRRYRYTRFLCFFVLTFLPKRFLFRFIDRSYNLCKVAIEKEDDSLLASIIRLSFLAIQRIGCRINILNNYHQLDFDEM